MSIGVGVAIEILFLATPITLSLMASYFVLSSTCCKMKSWRSVGTMEVISAMRIISGTSNWYSAFMFFTEISHSSIALIASRMSFTFFGLIAPITATNALAGVLGLYR